MALSEDVRISSDKIAEILPRKPAVRALIPITARELVEWTYAVHRAQGVPELSLEPQGRSQTGIVVDRMIEFAHLGCRVDVSSNAVAVWGEARCDEDAMTVHELIERMPVKIRSSLIRHGRLRSAPEWNPMILPLRCVPVPGRKGKPKGIYAHHGKTHIGSEITYEGDWPDRVCRDIGTLGMAGRPPLALCRRGHRVCEGALQPMDRGSGIALWPACSGR